MHQNCADLVLDDNGYLEVSSRRIRLSSQYESGTNVHDPNFLVVHIGVVADTIASLNPILLIVDIGRMKEEFVSQKRWANLGIGFLDYRSINKCRPLINVRLIWKCSPCGKVLHRQLYIE